MEFKLIIKKLNNTLTQEEGIIFSQWYNASANHKNYFDKVSVNYQHNEVLIDIEKGWNAIDTKINASTKKNNYWKYAVAASVALLISFSIVFDKKDSSQKTTPIIVNNNIEIGTDKAILTLENGTDVVLDEERNYEYNGLSSNGKELIYNKTDNSNSKITFNYLTIPRGGQFFLKLEDGTQVWLNSESKIKYPKAFVSGEPRQVELIYGEAYFDVSSSTNHKGSAFKVITQLQEVEVLGTEFNINAYKDDNHIYTTLVEGKVSIDNGITNEILQPNQQSSINIQNKDMAIGFVDVYNIVSWKNGIFSFKDKPLKEIMRTLSRWYDINIVFENEDLEDVEFNGVLNKKQNIEHILSIIKTTNDIEYEITEDEIIIR